MDIPPLENTNFRYVAPIGNPDAHKRRGRPGVYKVTFPVCDVQPVGARLRLLIRMVMTGPLESQAPSEITHELDVAGTFQTLRDEFQRLSITVAAEKDIRDACDTLLRRVEYVHVHRCLDQHAEMKVSTRRITEERADALLKGLPQSSRILYIAPSLLPPVEELKKPKWSAAVRRQMSREVDAWATVLRCEASPLPGGIGYEVEWEAHIDNYHDNPLIHRWTQRVESTQTYEELRRDLEVLCVDLYSYHDIERACAEAVGQNIVTRVALKDLGKAKAELLEHFTEKPHQLAPLSERLTRAQAEAYCREHRLEVFLCDLAAMRFVHVVPAKAETVGMK